MQLDRILQGVVMDRRGVVITGLESSQAIDEAFDNQLNELKFDLEGHAPRLGFKGEDQHSFYHDEANSKARRP